MAKVLKRTVTQVLEHTLSEADEVALGVMFKHGEKLNMIKYLRAQYGWGLKESKDWADAFCASQPSTLGSLLRGQGAADTLKTWDVFNPQSGRFLGTEKAYDSLTAMDCARARWMQPLEVRERA